MNLKREYNNNKKSIIYIINKPSEKGLLILHDYLRTRILCLQITCHKKNLNSWSSKLYQNSLNFIWQDYYISFYNYSIDYRLFIDLSIAKMTQGDLIYPQLSGLLKAYLALLFKLLKYCFSNGAWALKVYVNLFPVIVNYGLEQTVQR